jgi:hypothetical protein
VSLPWLQVAEDEGGFWMLLQHAVTHRQKLLVRSHILAVLIESLEGWVLLIWPQRFPAGRVVGNVQIDRHLQLGALVPDGVHARVVDVQALSGGHLRALQSGSLVRDLSRPRAPFL